MCEVFLCEVRPSLREGRPACVRRGLPVKKKLCEARANCKKTVPLVQTKKIKYAGIVDKHFIGAVNKTFYLGVFFFVKNGPYQF